MAARIVISEFMAPEAVALLRARHDVLYDDALVDDAHRLLHEAAGCDALIVRNRTQVRGKLAAALGRCKVVGRLGVGMDNIDVQACAAAGIAVIPATGANALSVAEYVVASAMSLLRGVSMRTADVAAGQWPRHALSQGRETAGKTLGVVGYGSIGQETARLARAVGMHVIAFDSLLPADHPAFGKHGVRAVSLDDLVAASHVVSLHVPLVDATRGLFNAARIAAMQPGAVLINTSRGHIVDVQAVLAALASGHLGGAAIDVFDQEPLPAGVVDGQGLNLLLTPHISGLSLESNERVSSLIADRVLHELDARVT